MAVEQKQKLEQQLWNIANTLRGKMDADNFSGFFQCLDNRPRILQARTIGDRIIAEMKEFVEVFVKWMVS